MFSIRKISWTGINCCASRARVTFITFSDLNQFLQAVGAIHRLPGTQSHLDRIDLLWLLGLVPMASLLVSKTFSVDTNMSSEATQVRSSRLRLLLMRLMSKPKYSLLCLKARWLKFLPGQISLFRWECMGQTITTVWEVIMDTTATHTRLLTTKIKIFSKSLIRVSAATELG